MMSTFFDLTHIALFFVCMLTSAITAGIGIGGGVLLLVIMSNILPPALVIPLHGATQLMSNFSRLVFDWRTVKWSLVRLYVPGAFVGGIFGFTMLDAFEFDYLPPILGVFILLITWTNLVIRMGIVFDNMFILGALQTFISLFVGAIGLILPPILLKKGLDKAQTIATQAAMMSIMHAFKVTTYVAAGFVFSAYIPLLSLMLIGSAIGSFSGRFLRQVISEQRGIAIMKWTITALALQLIIKFILVN